MARRSEKPEFKSPLEQDQCKTMFSLSHYAKEHGLLEGWGRKALFQAGRYETWFASSFIRLPDILEELIPDLDGSEGIPTIKEVEGIRKAILDVAHGYGIAMDGGTTKKTELALLRQKQKAGETDPPEILQLAELLEETGEIEEARWIARDLHRDHPDNPTVKELLKRLEA